jgi:predicted glycogen debranching enzyme
MTGLVSDQIEWLEADGLGGFSSGTTAGIRTRRYHALLLSAATPPTGRQVLVAGMDVELEIGGKTVALSSQRYAPGVLHPDGTSRLERFTNHPWPTWRYGVGDTAFVEQSLFVTKGLPITVLRWRAGQVQAGSRLRVRPFLAGRDYHSMHHENGAFRFDASVHGACLRWAPYDGVQAVLAGSNGTFRPQPDWYRQFFYSEEERRGLDSTEDLAAPGCFEWDLSLGDAVLILAAHTPESASVVARRAAPEVADLLEAQERRRRSAFEDVLDRSADAYIVSRGSGATLVAGYPWFTDWGRDTFIAMRGLCLARGRHQDARNILVAWADAVSEGMLPNRFPDGGDVPEFNAVDSSLWYVVAAHEWLTADPAVVDADRARVGAAIEAILDGYSRGTRFGIRAEADGLLAAGVPGVQLTWMDARVGDRVITPRIGKPVEIQALWINALTIGARLSPRWGPLCDRARRSFAERFWNDRTNTLFDVVDVDHGHGVDASMRPNQILAVGGLPFSILDGERARAVVDEVERQLWTPIGLRSLSPHDPSYIGKYAGGVAARDGAYHQGTVWPWLLGPFVEAWVRVRGNTPAARADARARFLDPLLAHLTVAGMGHLPEVADGDAPHAPGGCPFQAWSVGEAIRLHRHLVDVSASNPGSEDFDESDESDGGNARHRSRSHSVRIP